MNSAKQEGLELEQQPQQRKEREREHSKNLSKPEDIQREWRVSYAR